MKKIFSTALLSLLILVGCATSSDYFTSRTQANFLQEDWMHQVETNPRAWIPFPMRHFYDTQPERIEQCIRSNCREIAGTIPSAADFENIHAEGDFQIEIVGQQLPRAKNIKNNIVILGPEPLARLLVVSVENHTLYLRPIKLKDKDKEKQISLRDLVVRISMRDLQDLTVVGNMNIYGFNIVSRDLCIHSFGYNNILLFGKMSPAEIINQGNGTISIFGAYTPALNIVQNGNGTINLGGRIGVRSIVHTGNGDINIIGAYSPDLTIFADGGGKTSIAGWVVLRCISAHGCSRVYLYSVQSHDIFISADGGADIGIAGSAENLNVTLQGNVHFGGKCLHSRNGYIKTKNNVHANIWGSQKIFAIALDNSSVYAYGPPGNISRYTSGNGWVLPLQNDVIPLPPMPFNGSWDDSLNTAGRKW